MGKGNTMKKDRTIQTMILGVFFVLVLIWINTFIHQNSFTEGLAPFSFLITALIAVAFTIVYYWCTNSKFDDDPIRETTQLCVAGTAVSGILMLFALLLELGTDSFSLYGEKEIILWCFTLPKKYVYDIWAIIVFPTNISIIFRAMYKEHFDLGALIYGSISILGLTLEGCLIFMAMSNIWMIDLMILNTITIVLAVWKYVVHVKKLRKRNIIGAVILYGVVRIALLPLLCDRGNGTIASFMFEGDWSDLMAGINEIVRNASFFGTSDYLLNSEFIHSWLANRNKPVLQLLYYGGWVSVIALVLFLICFLVVLVKLLGVKNGRKHQNWMIFGTAAVMFFIRTIMGLMYSFGFPYPIALPFLGLNGSIMDAMAFTLLLIGAWENRKINLFEQMGATFVSAENVLGVQDAYCIINDSGAPYTEDIYDDKVDIIGDEAIVHCNVDWYTVSGREFYVFETKSKEFVIQRFILEYVDRKWISLTASDSDVIEEIKEEYMSNHQPYCMVVEEECKDDTDDEEYDFED